MTYASMDMKKPSADPTRAELEILQVLWHAGPSSVREVWAALGSKGSYTTILKLLQVMLEKGLVNRDTSHLSHIYRPAVAREASQKRMVRGLIERAFGGSVGNLILSALAAKPATQAELEAIRDLLAQSSLPSRSAASGKKKKSI
jgi:BlaI family transcriptional regulator, penicillinase repressor